VFPTGEDEDGGVGGVRGCGVGDGDGVFHGASSHAFVVVFLFGDVSGVVDVWCVTAA
jgi:hypothetical protein